MAPASRLCTLLEQSSTTARCFSRRTATRCRRTSGACCAPPRTRCSAASSRPHLARPARSFPTTACWRRTLCGRRWMPSTLPVAPTTMSPSLASISAAPLPRPCAGLVWGRLAIDMIYVSLYPFLIPPPPTLEKEDSGRVLPRVAQGAHRQRTPSSAAPTPCIFPLSSLLTPHPTSKPQMSEHVPHFVRCIKPNTRKMANTFVSPNHSSYQFPPLSPYPPPP